MNSRIAVMGAALIQLAACQSSNQQASNQPASNQPAANAVAENPAAADGQLAFATPAQTASSPAQCAIAIAAGPPPKPSKGADFGKATAKNIGKGMGRNLIANIGGAVAGPLGGAVAGGLAADAIRSEQDMKGRWTATDGSPTCGCSIDIKATTNLQMKTANKGKLSPVDCGNPLLAQARGWTLGHSFTGYDAPFQLLAADGASIATLNRDGVDYFSGTLSDGTSIVLWRK